MKQSQNIPQIPDELIYSLWSIGVGYCSVTSYPLYINEAYTAIPDFHSIEVQQILTYLALFAIIDESIKHYCAGQIRFDAKTHEFHFGNEVLTKGIEFLLVTYGDQKIGEDKTITQIFELIRENSDSDSFNPEWRRKIKREIELHLDRIGYWDRIPIPFSQ